MCCGVAIWPTKLDLISLFSQNAILTVVDDDKMIFVPWDVFFGLALKGMGGTVLTEIMKRGLIIRP